MSQAETRSGIDSLHARAEASYRSGDFEDARAAWNEILALDPADERAREGLKLLSLVDPKWAVFEEAERAAGGEPAAEAEEIRGLVRAGQLVEARRRLDALAARLPGDEAVASLAREIAAAESRRSLVEEHLAVARGALAAGDPGRAAEVCRRVLADVPGDREAERLLEEAEAALAEAAAPGSPPAGEPAPELPLDLELDLSAVPGAPAGAVPPVLPEPGPPAGAGEAGEQARPGPGGDVLDPGTGGGETTASTTPPAGGDIPVPGTGSGSATAAGEAAGPEIPEDLPVIPLAAPPPAEPAVPGAAAAGEAGIPAGEDPADLEDLFEAARELERDAPVTEPPEPGAGLPPEPPAAGDGEAGLLVARAREELERGNTAEATQLAARALAIDAAAPGAEEILDEARRRDEDRARQAEDLVGQAVRALDEGQPHLAIPLLKQVLELIPGHLEARDLLARAEAAEAVLPEIPADADLEDVAAVPVGAPPEPETHDLRPVEEEAPAPPAEAPPPAPPGPAEASARPGRGSARRRRAPRMPGRGILVAAALLLVAAGGVAAWRLGLLPVGDTGRTAEQAPRPVRRRVKKQGPEGKQPAGPARKGGGKEAGRAARPAGAAAAGAVPAQDASRPAPRVTKRDVPGLVHRAERALRSGNEARAVELLELARQADPLDFDLVEKLETARTRLRERKDAEARLARGKQEFRQGNWPEALRIFYRIPGPYRPAGIDRWIADGWYNMGIQALKAGNVVEARRYFSDCLELAPDDEVARRHREVALRYRGQPLDDAYWMYVRALQPRPLRE